jgi:hypothetical protein
MKMANTTNRRHPEHPRCSECNKAMYKTMNKGQPVKKDDPWAFCRNDACELYGKDQTNGTAPEQYLFNGEQPSKGEKKKDKAKDKAKDKVKDKTKDKGDSKGKDKAKSKSNVEQKESKKSKKKKSKKVVESEPGPEAEDEEDTNDVSDAKKKGDDSSKDGQIRADLLEGKLSQAEIIFKRKTTRHKVRQIRNELQDEGLI